MNGCSCGNDLIVTTIFSVESVKYTLMVQKKLELYLISLTMLHILARHVLTTAKQRSQLR